MQKVAIIGAGAAGFFSALTCATYFPDAQITIFEKSSKVLSKVRISGGGRCNVTNAITNPVELIKYYPRGNQKLKQAFKTFGTQNIRDWFEKKGVKLKTESDGRVFPVSDNSQTIIDCFLRETQIHGIQIRQNTPIQKIEISGNQFKLISQNNTIFDANKVIVTTGGSPKLTGFRWLADLGHQIESPVPSLFTFNIPNNLITSLSGISIPQSTLKISGTKLESKGALLITHRGMSGPAILKLSAFGAKILADRNYHFELRVSWLIDENIDNLRDKLHELKIEISTRKVNNRNPFYLPNRLWQYFIQKADIQDIKTWQEISKKQLNRLAEILTNDTYQVQGKATFKDEFVTCGGVSLNDIDLLTMESRKVQGLFFAGEVLDIDGVTGGFNFQSAWTTGFIAGRSILLMK